VNGKKGKMSTPEKCPVCGARVRPRSPMHSETYKDRQIANLTAENQELKQTIEKEMNEKMAVNGKTYDGMKSISELEAKIAAQAELLKRCLEVMEVCLPMIDPFPHIQAGSNASSCTLREKRISVKIQALLPDLRKAVGDEMKP
jgi:hypothetical protein